MLSLLLMSGFSSVARAQNWTVDYLVDEAAAAQSLGGQHRVTPMNKAINRVKAKVESILAANAGSSLLSIVFEAPAVPSAIAQTNVSQRFTASVSVTRDRLINVATANLESNFEILLYESLPPSGIPFRFDTATIRSASSVVIPNALNNQLQFGLTANQNDGTIRIRPQSSILRWQLFPNRAPTPNGLNNYESFEATLMHETLHALGYSSGGDNSSIPTELTTMDILRIASASTPINAASFINTPRELRPTVEASLVTQLGTTSGVYPLSRGTRAGGDGDQPSHWRSATRLNPQGSIGVMDPSGTLSSLALRSNQFITRADVAGLDLMGWNADPTLIPLVNAGQVNLIAPIEMAQISPNQPITFGWSGDTYICWVVQVYAGTDAGADDSDNVFFATDNLPPQQTSFQVPADVVFPPGTYSWYVVSYTQTGYITSEARVFVVEASCDPDVNQDGNTDQTDIEYFINVVAGGPNPTGIDSDFNQDGNVDSGDTEAMIIVVAGGACPRGGSERPTRFKPFPDNQLRILPRRAACGGALH